MDVRFSPDGSKVIVSANDGGSQVNVFGNLAILIFDVNAKKLIQRYELKQQLRKTGCNVTLPFAVTADSSQIFTLTQDCRIGLYDIQTFQEIRSFGTPYADHALSFALSPDGNTLAVASAKSFELWDVPSGTKFRRVDIPELAGSFDNYFHRIVFSPDGKAVIVKSGISFSTNSIVTIWGIPEVP
jgi:WD40 repeat protein